MERSRQNQKNKSRLYDYLASSIIYLIDYSKKHDFILPHKDRQIKMIDESEKIMDEISPPNFKHPNGTPRDQQNQLLLLLRKLTN